MSLLLLSTFLIATLLFLVGSKLARHRSTGIGFLLQCALGGVIALPGILFAAYYLRVFGEPVWLYQFRSLPNTELTAGGSGLLAGLLHGRSSGSQRFQRLAGRWFFPGMLAMGLLVPYLKPLLRPPQWSQFHDRWSDGVCLQSTESSCGPACAATLLRLLGQTTTEEQIARESLTSRSGTENWYLARTLRRHGARVEFVSITAPWPFPAIAGVRLPDSGNAGHFITILGRSDDNYIVGDPLEGRRIQSPDDLRDSYVFTGFFLVVQ